MLRSDCIPYRNDSQLVGVQVPNPTTVEGAVSIQAACSVTVPGSKDAALKNTASPHTILPDGAIGVKRLWREYAIRPSSGRASQSFKTCVEMDSAHGLTVGRFVQFYVKRGPRPAVQPADPPPTSGTMEGTDAIGRTHAVGGKVTRDIIDADHPRTKWATGWVKYT